MHWKSNWENSCGKLKAADLNDMSAEDLYHMCHDWCCDDAPVAAEKVLEYIVLNERLDVLAYLSLEDLIRLAYIPSIRGISELTGPDFLRKDRENCPQKISGLLRKAAKFKNKLSPADYTHWYLYNTALFEICRRNDADLLRIYLDEFDGFCHKGIYDAVSDYYIWMYLPDWELLKEYNNKNHPEGDWPGTLSQCGNTAVSTDVQKKLLDILIRQAEKSKVPRPEVLEIMLQHNIPSCRSAFPVNDQDVHLGVEFSNRHAYETRYAARIIFHYDDRELAPDQCIDPWDLDDLLSDSGCAIPVTCSCGDPGCAGIEAVAESRVYGEALRLYIPIGSDIYYFDIKDRIGLRRELLLMLKHAIRTLQCHARWQKNGSAPQDYDNEEDAEEKYAAFLPEGTDLPHLRKLCRAIAGELENKADK